MKTSHSFFNAYTELSDGVKVGVGVNVAVVVTLGVTVGDAVFVGV